jgi:hypothetical protein
MDDDRLTLAARELFYLGLAFSLLVVLAITNVAYILMPVALFAAPACLLAGLVLFFGFHNRDGMRDRHSVWLAWIGGGAFLLLVFVVLLQILMLKSDRAYQSICPSQQRQIAIALDMYRQDNGNRMPTSFYVLDNYIGGEKVFNCPEFKGAGYGYNGHIVGIDFNAVTNPADALLTADSVVPNSIITYPAQIAHSRHISSTGCYISYLDGHAAFVGKRKKVELEVKLTVAPSGQ